jgi:hypothetical protein
MTRQELDRWYRKNAPNLNHSDWKENYQVLKYLKKYMKYQLRGKKEEGPKRPPSNPLDRAYRINRTIKVNRPTDE